MNKYTELNSVLFNFLDPKLSPFVRTSSPATDNYEVDNLVSENFTKKNLGFIAYSSVKPPVDIEFTFICPVNIHYIMLKTMVGSQKSTGIEIMAKNDSQEYTYISKSIYNQLGVFFCNSKIYSKDSCPKNFDHNLYHMAYFNRSSYRVFLEATSLKIIIFRTEKSVPCLGAIEVWGMPAKSCSKVTKETVIHIMMKEKQQLGSSEGKQDQFTIPNDFKDDLTYDLMTIPMTLPSGKTVDQSTLDKHVENERLFGRKPCDPFTGIKFTEKLKPILNVSLKSRIDMFMLQNNSRSELFNYKRTLGRAAIVTDSGKNKKVKMTPKDKLEEAIEQVRNSSNFINITSINRAENDTCVTCQNHCNFLYKILCKHLYCRQCLVIILKHAKCSLCQKSFCTKDIQKINV